MLHLLLHVLGSVHQPASGDGFVKSIMHQNSTLGFPDMFHDALDISLRYNCSLQPSVLIGFVRQGFETLQHEQREQEKPQYSNQHIETFNEISLGKFGTPRCLTVIFPVQALTFTILEESIMTSA